MKGTGKTVREIIEMHKGQCTEVEVYVYSDKTERLHSDFIENVDEVCREELYMDCEAADYELMGEDDYNRTVLANTCMQFSDCNDPGDKILVVVLPWGWNKGES